MDEIKLLSTAIPIIITLTTKTDKFLGLFNLKRESIEKLHSDIFAKIKILKKKNLKDVLSESKEISDARLSDIVDEKDRIDSLEMNLLNFNTYQEKYFDKCWSIFYFSVFMEIILVVGILFRWNFIELLLKQESVYYFSVLLLYIISISIYFIASAKSLDKRRMEVTKQNRNISDPRENNSGSNNINL